ncbi:probable serine/threonine-protein kinase PBL1 [Mercurialis annua]|uniref:probable serine/threonine-protein kinase PBL1 n=1 Tax=Mercurialis annua TaxID=3986 RepID=UPI00215E59A0|nr:probable serine/threonine-protein kinase PBL1 [Mercurialis annua]
MGCFTVLKSKKKKPEPSVSFKRVSPKEQIPTTLPEPQIPTRTLQSAPPSFRTRVKPVQQENRAAYNRTRALSAPESLDAAEQDDLAEVECDEHEESKSRVSAARDHPSPQPLPLPTAVLKPASSFKSASGSGPLCVSGPLPLPPGVTHSGTLKTFSYDEIMSACRNFSSDRCVSEGLSSIIYWASFGDDTSSSKKFDATVTRLHPSPQGLKEFISEVHTLASLRHPNLCKLLGYHAHNANGTEQRMLIYERLYHGSLDRLLYGRLDGPPLDWNTRMKIALCAAQGLTFLHEEGPFQAMYNEFSTGNIQIDKDFSAKLSGYGCVGHIPETDIPNSSGALANLSVETLERGLLTPKSNVWSFGIVLLELLTGRKNLDNRHPKEERNLVRWTRPYLADECRLSLIMDPQLKGRFPPNAARTIAEIAVCCLQNNPLERPTMRGVVEKLKVIQDMKYSTRFPLQEPAAVAGKHMSRSPSLNGIITPAPRLSFSPSPPSRTRPSVSPTRPPALPLSLPPRACSSNFSNFSLDELERQESRKSSSAVRRASVEGF